MYSPTTEEVRYEYAVVEGGVVVGSIDTHGEIISATHVTKENAGDFIGWGYAAGIFTPPIADEPAAVTAITLLAFRNRFTMAEKQGIYTAAETVVDIRVFLDDIAAASEIDLTDPQTIAGVQALEAVGLITTVRATEILTP